MVNSLAWEKPKIPVVRQSPSRIYSTLSFISVNSFFRNPKRRGRAREGRLSPLGPPEDPGRLHVSQQIDTVLDGAEAM